MHFAVDSTIFVAGTAVIDVVLREEGAPQSGWDRS
jgi:hypothetical protein